MLPRSTILASRAARLRLPARPSSWTTALRPAAAVPRLPSASSASFSTPIGPNFWAKTGKQPYELPKDRVKDSPQNLKELFDEPVGWDATFRSHPTGLFEQDNLVKSALLPDVGAHVVRRVELIRDRLHRAPSAGLGELQLVVKNFDRLSDLLCGVIDLCEVVVNVHPDKRWRRKAEITHENLCRLMNEMNVDVKLYDALRIALETPEVVARMSQEEYHTAQVFKHDFQKSGIHLQESTRELFVNYSDSLLQSGRQFTLQLSGPKNTKTILPDASKLVPGLGQSFVRRVAARDGAARIAVNSWEGSMILRKAEDEDARRAVWTDNVKGSEYQEMVLNGMLDTRRKMAGVVGRNSWGEVELENKMAQSPANVTTFLQSLAAANRPATLAEIDVLRELKRQDGKLADLPALHPWDRDFYLTKHQAGVVAAAPRLEPLAPYFSVGTIFTGLSRLFEALYGITLVPVELRPGEVWHPSVRRLDVVDHRDEGGRTIGTIYCDLFQRADKAGGAAHYTVRCSRRVDDDDLDGDLPPGQTEWPFDPSAAGLSCNPVTMEGGREGRYQLPIVVLNCGFATPVDGPTLLDWAEVETIFHEMGHAMHSMIGRTSLHNVSGTRVATDLAELPSILMEAFTSPSMLPHLVSHYETDKPPSEELLRAHQRQRSHFPSLETATQIHMALLDQSLHSISPKDPNEIDSTRIYHEVTGKLDIFRAEPGTAPQVYFGHLYGYGASYYAYLFDRAIANRVWDVVFARGAGGLDGLRDGGQRLKDHLLRWGGGRESWGMVGALLDDDVIRAGGKEAMMRVGEWGVGDVKR